MVDQLRVEVEVVTEEPHPMTDGDHHPMTDGGLPLMTGVPHPQLRSQLKMVLVSLNTDIGVQAQNIDSSPRCCHQELSPVLRLSGQ